MKIHVRLILNIAFIFTVMLMVLSCASLKPEEPSLLSRMAELHESSIEGRIDKNDRQLIKMHALVRKSLFDKLQDTISECDTLILFSAYDIQTGRFEGTLWTPQKSFNYVNKPGMPVDTLDITEGKPLYSDFIITNVLKRNWDAIQSREKEQGALLGGNLVRVFYIHKENEECSIDYFTFEEFFDALTGPN